MLSRRTLLQSAALASVAMPYLADRVGRGRRWPAQRHPFDLRLSAGLRRRRVRALLRQEARGQARQDRHYRKQDRRVRQHRDRIRGEIQTRRLHAVHRARQFVPCRRAELVQEVGVRSGQRLRTRDDALQAAVHPGCVGRQSLQIASPISLPYLKQQGDKASYASVANTGLVSSELYKANFGLNTVEVKYKDARRDAQDLWGHNVAFAHLDPVTGDGAPQDRQAAGARDVVARSDSQALPDIPSARRSRHHELGHHRLVVGPHAEGHAEAGRSTSSKHCSIRLRVDDETKTFLANLGSDPFPGDSQMLKACWSRTSRPGPSTSRSRRSSRIS